MPGTCYVFRMPGCHGVDLVQRETLINPATSGKALQLTVNFDRVPQKRFLNLNSRPVRLDAEDSTWKVKGTDRTWNVGAFLGPHGSVSIVKENMNY